MRNIYLRTNSLVIFNQGLLWTGPQWFVIFKKGVFGKHCFRPKKIRLFYKIPQFEGKQICDSFEFEFVHLS